MRPSVTPEFEEMPRASASQSRFPRDYIPPRKDTAPQVRLPKDAKYPLVMPEIPPGVIIEGDLMGKVVALKFLDHDITDAQKFLELAWDKYLCTKSVPGIGAILVEPQSWASRLEKSGILNLLEIPHFGRSLEINACIKLLLSCIHGGTLWLDPPVSIDTQLIAWIMGLPTIGEDPKTLFANKVWGEGII
jgi:hypothetical protein